MRPDATQGVSLCAICLVVGGAASLDQAVFLPLSREGSACHQRDHLCDPQRFCAGAMRRLGPVVTTRFTNWSPAELFSRSDPHDGCGRRAQRWSRTAASCSRPELALDGRERTPPIRTALPALSGYSPKQYHNKLRGDHSSAPAHTDARKAQNTSAKKSRI